MDKSEWLVRILKGTTKYFDSKILNIPRYYVGEKRATDELNTWVEVRYNGPHFRALPREEIGINNTNIELTINTLISTVRDDSNIYDHYTSIGKAMKAYTLSLPITDENGDTIVCMTMDTDIDPAILVTHYGEVTPASELLRSSIEATYKFNIGVDE